MLLKKILIVEVVLIFVALVAFCVMYFADTGPKVYSDKSKLCMDFAQSYLATVPKTDGARSGSDDEKWQIAVDIETDFYNQCMLDLNEKALREYKSLIMEKYKK